MYIEIGKELKELLHKLTKKDKEYIDNQISWINQEYSEKNYILKTTYNVQISYEENIELNKIELLKTHQKIKEVLKKELGEDKVIAGLCYIELNKSHFEKPQEYLGEEDVRIGLKTTPVMFQGHKINELFSRIHHNDWEEEEEEKIKLFLEENLNLLPLNLKRYVNKKIKERQQKSIFEKLTNDFDYAIFDNNLEDKITIEEGKNLLKSFNNLKEEDQVLSETYLINSMLNKYSNQTNFSNFEKQIEKKMIYIIRVLTSSFINKYIDLTKDNAIKIFEIIKENKKMKNLVCELYKENKLRFRTLTNERMSYFFELLTNQEEYRLEKEENLIKTVNSFLSNSEYYSKDFLNDKEIDKMIELRKEVLKREFKELENI